MSTDSTGRRKRTNDDVYDVVTQPREVSPIREQSSNSKVEKSEILQLKSQIEALTNRVDLLQSIIQDVAEQQEKLINKLRNSN